MSSTYLGIRSSRNFQFPHCHVFIWIAFTVYRVAHEAHSLKSLPLYTTKGGGLIQPKLGCLSCNILWPWSTSYLL